MSGIFKSLQPKDVRVTPFRAHKTVVANFDANESSSYCKVYSAENSLSSSYNYYQQATTNLDAGNTHPEFEPEFARTTDGYFKTAIHTQLDHLYFREYLSNNKATLGGGGNINVQYRDLGYKAKVISFPNNAIGEGILPGSLSITGSGYTIEDDAVGNLILKTATGLTSPDPCDYDNLMLSYTFNRYYKYVDQRREKGPVVTELPATYGSTRLYASFSNVMFERVDTSGSIAVNFVPSYNSVVKLIPAENQDFRKVYNFSNKEYAIAFRFRFDGLATSGASLVTKLDYRDDYAVSPDGDVYIEQNPSLNYPYKLEIRDMGSGPELIFKKSNGITTLSLGTTSALTPGNYYSVVAQRSGSTIGLYVTGPGGSIGDTVQDPYYTTDPCESNTDLHCANDSMIRLGNDYSLTEPLSGSIDYIHIFDRYLTTNEISDLHQTTGSINRFCGNVFYNTGLVVLTHPKVIDPPITKIITRGTVTLLETEVMCTVGPGEFTTTHNRSVHSWNPSTNQYEIGCQYQSSSFRPYVTTVGLYDNSHNLVAVAKLSTPIQTSRTTDTTFVVRFDR